MLLDMGDLSYIFTNGTEKISFPLKIINKKNMTELNQCALVNEYINYKGKKWYDELFEKIKDVHTEITYTVSSSVLEKLESLDVLIEYLDPVDIGDWLVNIKKLKIPKDLISKFTEEIRHAGRLNEAQTYTVDDYILLAAEVVRLKILLGPLSYYHYLNSNKFIANQIEYVLVKLHLDKMLEKSKAFDKIINFVKSLITTVDTQIIVIEKRLPVEELPNYISYITLLQRIATAPIVNDLEKSHVINDIYGYCTGKLGVSGDVTKMIRPKITASNDDTSGNESASILESYKTTTLNTPGELVEVSAITSTVESVIKNSPDYLITNVDVIEVKKILKQIRAFYEDANISKFTEKMLKLIFDETVNQISIDDVDLDNILILIAVGKNFLDNIGYKPIAELLISKEVEFRELTYITRNRKDKDLYNKLNVLYFDRGTAHIDSLVAELFANNWVNINGTVTVEKDIVNDLARLHIQLVENNRDIKENYNLI